MNRMAQSPDSDMVTVCIPHHKDSLFQYFGSVTKHMTLNFICHARFPLIRGIRACFFQNRVIRRLSRMPIIDGVDIISREKKRGRILLPHSLNEGHPCQDRSVSQNRESSCILPPSPNCGHLYLSLILYHRLRFPCSLSPTVY
jgi:hypothetical protein